MPSIKLIFAFAMCTGAIASKDLIIKYLFCNDVLFSQLILYTGMFSLCFSIIFSKINKEKFLIVNKQLQLIRMFIACASSGMAFLSLKLLPSAVMNIGSKITLPLIILLSPILNLTYSKKVRVLALYTIGVMFLFLFQALSICNLSLYGIIVLLISAVFMIAEYMLLSKTVQSESPALVSAIPGLSLILLGLGISTLFGDSLFNFTNKSLFGMVLCGFFYFLTYRSGLIRYKLLPPGLAEYPSLLTIAIIWPVDTIFFNGKISFNVLVFGLTSIILLGVIIREHNKHE